MEHLRTSSRVLIVDDEETQRSALALMVSSWGFVTETASDGEEALAKLATFPANVILTDLMMPNMDGKQLLRQLREQGSSIPALVITAFGNLETALETIHDLGAFWFLEKPIQPRELRLLLERAMQQSRLAERASRLEQQLSYQGVLGEMTGNSRSMQEVFALIRQVAPSKAAVLVTGESGTGKELAARAIHALSPRASGPFVAVNCAALPETLIESELFGHEKGAFTGALERRAGCFELAHGGTLLLDEIGDMPLATQAKLLRVLEDSKVRRLGGKQEIVVDVRVIAATNKPLEEAIRKNSFREDLYYRLNVFPISLPPLRERKEDLPALAAALIPLLNRKHSCKVTEVSPAALERLSAYDWPGNVRELRNVLERAVILAGEGAIGLNHLPAFLHGEESKPTITESPNGRCVTLPVGSTIDQAERALIELTLQHTKNNKTRAAEILGISLKTLFNKLKGYGAADAEEN
ncbi:MAG: sigma-54 dependent transcriptional regulator [Bryobacteraceae bacterium]|nr:sigma-54 dependent transcriptional regulator [Bryobacteraceae bacterium]MDW8379929.1 sigma-54 dependent transcriptional regulator [Bryobacterales bacterium]